MERRTLLLNQLIIVFNSFKIGWACVMLEISAETPSNLSKFYAIMFELGFDIAGVDIDEKFLSIFRNILNENEHQSKILRSFQNQRRCEWW